MHIGFISIESPFGRECGCGLASYLEAVIPALVMQGHRVTVIAAAKEGGISSVCDSLAKIVRIRLPSIHWYCSKIPVLGKIMTLPLRQLEYSWKFYTVAKNIFKSDPVDIIESAELGAFFFAQRPIAPLIIRTHGNEYVFSKYIGKRFSISSLWSHHLDKIILRRARAITSPSYSYAKEVAAQLSLPEDRIHIIPNPLNPKLLEVATEAVTPKKTNVGQYILYVGRIAEVKGIFPFLAAINEVEKSFPDIKVILAGPWQLPQTPQELGITISKSISEEAITWLGYVSGDKLSRLYKEARVCIVPSYFESFGIAALEAMFFGLPVVATNVGGLPEVVENGVTGLLVSPGDSKALAGAILRLLNDFALCRSMGEAGHRRALANFNAERIAIKIIELYKNAIMGRAAK
ncbi:MAG: glycosyltransferase family 4 protein [Candidatus Omnitrophica bacterium]|nr:glycosyltransferase family 4 protein [Candidatus Omnitrophota bacterium]